MENNNNSAYLKLLVMMAISFFVMYAVMFSNVESLEHIYLSYSRLYMTLLMIAPMGILMLLMMKKMYQNQKLNFLILGSCIIIIVFALTSLRSQAFISDTQYMKAMIPHHSSAILASKNANLKNAEVRKLSDSIIKAQIEEIEKMKLLLDEVK